MPSKKSLAIEKKFKKALSGSKSQDDKLDRFFKVYWDYRMKSYPEEATWAGVRGYNDVWTDLSITAIERRKTEARLILAVFRSIRRSKLSAAKKTSYDVFLYDWKIEIESQKFPEEVLQVNQMIGLQTDFPIVLKAAPTLHPKDFDDRIARLKALPQKIDEVILLLKKGIELKVTPPRVTIGAVPDQLQGLMPEKVKDSPIFTSFKEVPKAFGSEKIEKIQAQAEAVIRTNVYPALKRLRDYFKSEYIPQAVEQTGFSNLPDGQKWYELRAKRYTTTSMSPEQIHRLGLAEVSRIKSEMETAIREAGEAGSVKEFAKKLREDPQFRFASREHLLQYSREIGKRLDQELPKFFGVLPRVPYGVCQVPEYSERSQPAGYYEPGSLKTGRAGMVALNTYNLESRFSWAYETLMAHEGVPGHHLQVAIANELEGVPEFRKFNWYVAYGEGWALYAERLAREMGLYKDPYSRFGHLSDEMWRAVRLVVDTGLHVFGWSRDRAIEFFKENTGTSESDIRVEVDRYLVWPGQALGYKIGQLKILEIRHELEKKLGKKFDVRAFHDKVLSLGAVPLEVLERECRSLL